METLLQDIRYAVATLRRNPTFATAGLLTLALGIGATTAVFSVVYGVLMRPLPYPAAERLIRVWEEHPGGTPVGGNRWISNRTYHAWSERPRTIDVLGGFGSYETRLPSATITCGRSARRSRPRCWPVSARRRRSDGCSRRLKPRRTRTAS